MTITQDLDLDIAAALRNVDKIERALDTAVAGVSTKLNRELGQIKPVDVKIDVDRAAVQRDLNAALSAASTANIKVDVDRAAVQRDLNAALSAASTANIKVDVDRAELTRDIEAAIRAADTRIRITATATDVTSAINAAIAAANNRIRVQGDVDIRGAGEAESSSSVLLGNFKQLGGVLAGYAGIESLQRIVDETSALEQAGTKVDAVFGDAAASVEQFAATAATEIGFSRTLALQSTGTFGNFLTTSGLAQKQAADMSITLTKLAGDLSSFNDISPEEAFIKLRAGLAGEIEPLRAIGISITEAETKAKALELGLADLGEEVSQQAKLQARYALILEKSTNAQGDFARTSDTYANQIKILQAQFTDLITTVGAPLVSPLLAVLQSAVPILSRAAEAFGEVAAAILPAVDAVLVGAAPALDELFGGIGEIATNLTPALVEVGEAFGGLVGATAPLIDIISTIISGFATAVSGLLTLGDGIGIVIAGVTYLGYILGAAATALIFFGVSIPPVSAAFASLSAVIAANPLGALLVAFGAVITALGIFKNESDKAASAYDNFNRGVADSAGKIQDQLDGSADSAIAFGRAYGFLGEALSDYLLNESQFVRGEPETETAFRNLGLSVEELGHFLRNGSEGFNEFVARAIAAGEVELEIDGVRQTAADVRLMEGNLSKLLAEGKRAEVVVGEDLVSAFNVETKALQTASFAAATNAVATGEFTQAQLDFALALAQAEGDGDAYGRALELLGTRLNDINSELDATEVPLGQQAAAWTALAEGILSGKVASEDYQGIAGALGTDLETVTNFANGLSEAIQESVDLAVSALPNAGTALQNFASEYETALQKIADDMNEKKQQLLPEGETLSADLEVQIEDLQAFNNLGPAALEQFLGSLDDTQKQIDDWQANLSAIPPEFQRVFDFLKDQGPENAGKLAAAFVQFPQYIAPFEAQLAAIEASTSAVAELVAQRTTDTLEETTALAQQQTAEFAANLDFASVTQEQLDLAGLALLVEATKGAGGLADQSKQVGLAMGEGIKEGLVLSGVAGVSNRTGDGKSFSGKIVGDIEGLKKRLGINSPSKVTMEIGRNLGEGLLIGLNQFAPKIQAANLGLGSVTSLPAPSSSTTTTNTNSVSIGALNVYPRDGSATADEVATELRAILGA